VIEPGAVIDGGTALLPAATHRRRLALPSSAALAFGGLIGWSAFLLFSVEPMIGRVVLPVFGGTPAVWATTLFFFQAVLLLGYLYGHLSVTRLGMRRGAVVHVGLITLAAGSMLIAPGRAADLRNAAIPEVLNLIAMLTLTIGLPAFVLTTTTPLVSAWYARSHAGAAGGDAYWLYALSNAGSLLALLAYPFVIEPRLGLSTQRGIWAVGFVAFGIAIAACAAWANARATAVAARPSHDGDAVSATTATTSETIVWRRRLTWLLLAAVPSGLLNAVTTFIATDLVSAPLLWLVPLAIYLGTFIVAFSDRGRRLVPGAVVLAPAAVTLMWVPYGSAGGWPILPLVTLMYGGLAIVATALHGRLALDRPAPAHLTEFYLVISIGGALASAFVALVAPVVFPGVWEFPILLVLALVALAVGSVRPAIGSKPRVRPRGGPIDLSPFFRGARWRFGPYAAAAAILGVFLVRESSLGAEAAVRWLLVGGLILLVGARPAFLAASTAFVLALAVLVLQPAAIFAGRSFFGVTQVLRPAGAPFTLLMNGTTLHGVQPTNPRQAPEPEAYYARPGPFGDIFRVLASDGQPHTVAVVGLGAGATAAYVRPGWSMTYFEIDPLVEAVASNPALFTYLSGATVRPNVVLGDARLSLQVVLDGSFDAIVVDAFSSDSVPTHLLTTEAMAQYARVVRPGGLILVHISNRYYDLAPAVVAAAADSGLTSLERIYVPATADAVAGASITDAVVATTSPSARDSLVASGWVERKPAVRPMTDDLMDILRFLRPLW
jgi:SAM-dependent methyltransferase